MLQNLHVKNLALIDESEVDFAGGLNILSGETGAGKSIIIGSINLALGGKVQKEMLRDPEKPALVELIFSVTEKQKQVLKQLDVETEDDEVILSRRITGGRGRSKSKPTLTGQCSLPTIAEEWNRSKARHFMINTAGSMQEKILSSAVSQTTGCSMSSTISLPA